MKKCTVVFGCLITASIVSAQHDPGRDAVRVLAGGEMDKGLAVVVKEPRRMNSPIDAAEIAFVEAMAASMQGDPKRALEHAKASVAHGLSFTRLQAGPRDVFSALHHSTEYAAWADELGRSLVHGPMLGCVTDRSVRFWMRTGMPAQIRVVVREHGTGHPVSRQGTAEGTIAHDYTAIAEVVGLRADTAYEYELLIGTESVHRGSFRTQPAVGKPVRCTVGFGGGAGYTPQYERMWATIRGRQLNAFLMLGDNVYIDDPEHVLTHRYCYYRRQSNPQWRAFTASTPVYAIYDDHDFGQNDCVPGPEIEKPAWKRTVWNIFRENWNNPAYGGGDEQPGCWFDFYIGDVHFILLDGRYYRDLKNGSMLGPVQKQWLFDRLKTSTGRFKVLASPVPWSPGVKPGSRDTWDGFPDEREAIFSFIEKEKINGVLLMAADRHRTDLRRIPRPTGYDLYEVMSSRLTNVHTHPLMENAKGSEFIFGYNKTCSFGELVFDTVQAEPKVTFRCMNMEGEEMHTRTLSLKELSLPSVAVGHAR